MNKIVRRVLSEQLLGYQQTAEGEQSSVWEHAVEYTDGTHGHEWLIVQPRWIDDTYNRDSGYTLYVRPPIDLLPDGTPVEKA
jgi:hypothetical protein